MTQKCGLCIIDHVDNTIAALEVAPQVNDSIFRKAVVHLMQSQMPHMVTQSISLGHSVPISLLLNKKRVFVCAYDFATGVSVHGLKGNMIGKYGGECHDFDQIAFKWDEYLGEVCWPHVCLSDVEGNVIVVDACNNRLQVM